MTSTAMIRAVLRRDEHVCVIKGPHCMIHATLADHRANRGQGGSSVLDDMANLVAACVLCNGDKEDATKEFRRKLLYRGLRISKRATNEQTLHIARLVPVLYPDGLRKLLASDGSFTVVPEAQALEVLALYGIQWQAVVS